MNDMNDYLELLTCAICCTHMSNNVKLCIRGHSVCCECYSNLTTCPYCRSPWSQTRNRNLEQLIALFPNTSKNKDLINNENLKCPRCHSLMEGAIMLCGDGHSICTKCSKDIYQCVLCPKLICYRRNFLLERFIDNVKTSSEKAPSSMAKVQVKCSSLILPCCAKIIDRPKHLYYHVISMDNHKRVHFKYKKFFRLHLRSTDNVTYAFLKPLCHNDLLFIRMTYCDRLRTRLCVEILELSETKRFKVCFKSLSKRKQYKSKKSKVLCELPPKFIMVFRKPVGETGRIMEMRSIYLSITLLEANNS